MGGKIMPDGTVKKVVEKVVEVVDDSKIKEIEENLKRE